MDNHPDDDYEQFDELVDQAVELLELLEQSSLGAPNARAIRDLTPPAVIDDIQRKTPTTEHRPTDTRTDDWPLWGLSLTTPRLVLTPDDDDGLNELVNVARAGVHPPDVQPFSSAWTDKPDLGLAMRQHAWRRRAAISPDSWSISFLARYEGHVIGAQGLHSRDFALRREVGTGSWLGSSYQGKGFGTEMRTAVLMFAFDHLGAQWARSAALPDNAASLAVSRKLGYEANGSDRHVIRGKPVDDRRLLLRQEAFRRPEWTLDVVGVAPCLRLLGL